MNALRRATEELEAAEHMWETAEAKDGNAFYRGRSERHYQQAAIYAAVAQAEQLKRIADALYAKGMFKEDTQYSIAELAQALQCA